VEKEPMVVRVRPMLEMDKTVAAVAAVVAVVQRVVSSSFIAIWLGRSRRLAHKERLERVVQPNTTQQ
jgi:hypothetical protein